MVHKMQGQLKSHTLNIFSSIQLPGLVPEEAIKSNKTD